MTPSGTPTSRPQAASSVEGQFAERLSETGVSASFTALNASWSLLWLAPHPSRMTRRTGRLPSLMADRNEFYCVSAGAPPEEAGFS